MPVSRKRHLAHAAPALAATVLVLVLPTFAYAGPGDLDPAFDGDGKVVTDVATQIGQSQDTTDAANAVAVDSSGRIVAAGFASTSDGDAFAVVRYQPDGALDKVFDFAPFCPGTHAQAIAIQPDGKIVVAGFAPLDTDGCLTAHQIALARYNADGSLDTDFGDNGLVKLLVGLESEGYGVAIADDGTIVVGGWASIDHSGAVDKDFMIARFDDTGAPLGSTTVDFPAGGDQFGRAVAIDAEGRIVLAGSAPVQTRGTDFALARFTSAGVLDGNFNTGGSPAGTVITDFEGFDDGANGVLIQGDGKIVAAGYATRDNNSNDRDFALARYDDTGALDPNFGDDGRVLTPFGDFDDEANGVALYPDGKIVAAGYTNTGTNAGIDDALARYSAGGVLDGAFGTGGLVTTDFADSRDAINGVALQSDGKIVVAGSTAPQVRIAAGFGSDFALARYGLTPPPSSPSGSPSTPQTTTAAQLNPCADDATGPSLAITNLGTSAVFGIDSVAVVSVSASDPSGLSVDPSTRSARLPTTTLGPGTFSTAAVDACGNRSEATFAYRVIGLPTIRFRLAPCRATAARVRVRISGEAALRSATGYVDGRRVVTRRFSGGRTARGLKIPTHGLKPGTHTVTVSATDRLGNAVRRSRSFTVCGALKPAFTG